MRAILKSYKNNWEKLSFEWDEACDVFTDYIQSLGLKDHATDGQGNQITFKNGENSSTKHSMHWRPMDPDKGKIHLK